MQGTEAGSRYRRGEPLRRSTELAPNHRCGLPIWGACHLQPGRSKDSGCCLSGYPGWRPVLRFSDQPSTWQSSWPFSTSIPPRCPERRDPVCTVPAALVKQKRTEAAASAGIQLNQSPSSLAPHAAALSPATRIYSGIDKFFLKLRVNAATFSVNCWYRQPWRG